MRWAAFLSPALALVGVVSAIGLAGCGGLEINSVWRDRDVKIDGVPEEWQGRTTYVESPNVAIGAMNDGEYLYVSLSSPVTGVGAQIVMRGLTVWLDPEGGKRKEFGIHCPIGVPMQPGEPREMMREGGGRKASQEMIVEHLDSASLNMEILRPREDAAIMLAPGEAKGVEVRLGYQDGRFVYELKVPMYADEDHPYAIGAERGGRIGIGFETPEIDREALRETMRSGGPGGGRPSGEPPAGAPPGGGRPGGTMGEMPERLEIWGKVRVAPGDEQAGTEGEAQ